MATIEGGEGVGKSLFTAGLAALLRQRGLEVVTTREPGGTAVADRIRALFAAPPPGESLTMKTEALLVSAARAQHIAQVIRPALAREAWVLCDRFSDSTRVYQGLVGGLPAAELEALIAFSTGGLQPDVTFLLDCPVQVSLARLGRRPLAAGAALDTVDRYDLAEPAVHERLRQGFLQVMAAHPERFVRIDAALSPEQMLEAAWRVLEERFGGER